MKKNNSMLKVLKWKNKKGVVKYEVTIIDVDYQFTEKQYKQFIKEVANLPLPKDIELYA